MRGPNDVAVILYASFVLQRYLYNKACPHAGGGLSFLLWYSVSFKDMLQMVSQCLPQGRHRLFSPFHRHIVRSETFSFHFNFLPSGLVNTVFEVRATQARWG